VLKVSEVGRDGQWLLPNVHAWDNVFGPDSGLVEAPAELYLREFRDTPVDDLDALAELCKLGMICPLSPYSDLPPPNDEQWRTMIVRFAHETGYDWRGDEEEREEVARRHLAEGVSPVHAAEVALRVRLMHRVTNHLLAHLDGEPVARAWRDCADEQDAWQKFADVTGAALRDFHVRVDFAPVEVPAGWPPHWPGGSAHWPGMVAPSLYSVGMLQLVNHLASGETVHTCANETCRRQFVRQLGRSTYGGHRKTGILYCTNACARAQYQREKRRRDKAARGGTAR